MRSLAPSTLARPAALVAPGAGGGVDGRLTVRVVPVVRLALLLLLVANLGRVPVFAVGGRAFPILVNDLAVAGVIAVGGVFALQRRRLELDRVAVLALLFAAVGAASAVLAIPRFGLSLTAVLVSLSYLARWLFYLAVYVVVINAARARDVDGLWGALEGTILLFAAFGVFQSIFLPGFAQMVYPDSRAYLDWDPQGHRLVSTFLDPNYAGALILVGLMVHGAQLSMGARVPLWKPLLLFAALLMTASRGSVLAFAVGGFALLLVRGLSKQILRALALAGILLAAALPRLLAFARSFNKLEIDASAMTRIVDWLNVIEVFRDNPLYGAGFNTWGFLYAHYGRSSEGGLHAASFGVSGGLLFVAAMTGVVGLALYTAYHVVIVRRSRYVWRDARRPASHRGIALGGAVMVPTILVHSLFTNTIFYPFLMEPLWVLWALSFAMLRGDDDQPAAPIAPARPGPRVVALAARAGA